MSVGRICVRSVVVAGTDESVLDAAQRMSDQNVGLLVVVDAEDRPRGTLTDRDIVTRCVAKGLDPATVRISSVMSSPVSFVHESTPIEDALSIMAGHETKRLVVLADGAEQAVGILAMDDVLELLSEEFGSIGKLLRR